MNVSLNPNSLGALWRQLTSHAAAIFAVLPSGTTGQPWYLRIGEASYFIVIQGIEHYLQPKPTTTTKAG
jgi:hypothetical protein